jgi:AcrR family transcriptional regulator
LSRDRVLRAAVRLADRDGIDSLTMRKLGEHLGAGPMSLYYHVANKQSLLDGMVDVVFSEIELPSVEVHWKQAMRRRAISTREGLRRHPWAVGRMEATRSPGPNDLRLHDAVLRCLRHAGFSVEMSVQAYSVQDAYIYGFALQERTLAFGTREEFAQTARKRVKEVAANVDDAARLYPSLAEVVGGYIAKHGYDAAKAFEFGLEVILDGLEKLRAAAGPGPRTSTRGARSARRGG